MCLFVWARALGANRFIKRACVSKIASSWSSFTKRHCHRPQPSPPLPSPSSSSPLPQPKKFQVKGPNSELHKKSASKTSIQSNTMSDLQQPDPTLIWAPDVVENVSTEELKLYLNFARTACIPGGGCNVEEALDVLYKCNGDIKAATKKLLIRETKQVVIWTLDEVHTFEHLFREQPKNFISISKDLKTKSVKDCVEFYYLWKQQQPPLQQQHNNNYLNLQQYQPTPPNKQTIKQEHQQFSDQQQQQQHQISLLYPPPQQHLEQMPHVILHKQEPPQELQPGQEQFPCRVCGRIFLKIKSRSAHMKRHKNERLYNSG